MTQILKDEAICLKKYLTEQELIELYALQDICKKNDNVNLKLELEYRRSLNKAVNPGLKYIDEFLYYADGKLISYLSISCFGGNIGEVTGMTHPEWRRNGIFTRLYQLARQEYVKRNYSKVLLLADRSSESGAGFIKAIGGSYDFSEYHMRLPEISPVKEAGPVTLRIAGSKDIHEIRRQNSVYFDDTNEEDLQPEELELSDKSSYLAMRDGEIIGKIEMEFHDSTAYIFGFGILPAYRSKGNGRATLQETLRLLADRGIRHAELDVVCTNSSALHLYQSCGFQEESVMDYYRSEPEA
jgi:ribosomal protein S18 acetylase RimI-like enzyme